MHVYNVVFVEGGDIAGLFFIFMQCNELAPCQCFTYLVVGRGSDPRVKVVFGGFATRVFFFVCFFVLSVVREIGRNKLVDRYDDNDDAVLFILIVFV